jgi:acyl carrier protein
MDSDSDKDKHKHKQIEEEVVNLCSSIFRKRVSLEDNFIDLGGNSIEIEKIIFEMKKRFHIVLTPIDVLDSKTLNDLVVYIINL